jgi:hypothetical protein
MAKLRTIILVTFVTLLIWAFAEGQSVQTKRTVAEITFPPVTADTYATRVAEDQGWRGRVELLVEGSTTSLERLESELRRAISLTPGMEGVPRESGEYTVDLRQALRNLPEFRTHGVTVVSAEPGSVRVVVEELRTIEVPVRVEVPPGEVEGAEARPAQVTVRLPARVADRLGGSASVVARVRSEDLTRFETGRQVTVPGVRLEPGPELAGVQPLEILRPQVDVPLVVRSKSEVLLLETVPIDIRIAPAELAVWEITVPPEEQFLKDVRVTGPSELIERIRSSDDDLEIRAYVRLPYDLLERGVTSFQAEFTRLPTPLTIEVEDREVRLTAKRRETAPVTGNGGAEE